MNISKTTIQDFRTDFKAAVAALSTKYGVDVTLGTVRFDKNEFRGRLVVTNRSSSATSATPDNAFTSFVRVGDKVKVNHRKVSGRVFVVVKKNSVNWKLKDDNGKMFNVSPSLVVKVN